jgi:exopolysaccharide biosynthesis polyprenyl glycosylphosphotransferase
MTDLAGSQAGPSPRAEAAGSASGPSVPAGGPEPSEPTTVGGPPVSAASVAPEAPVAPAAFAAPAASSAPDAPATGRAPVASEASAAPDAPAAPEAESSVGAESSLDGPRRPWYVGYTRGAVTVDAVAALAAGVVGALVPFGRASADLRLTATLALPVAYLFALVLSHGYERRYLGTTANEYRAVVRAVTGLVATCAGISWLLQADFSRGLVFVLAPSLLVLGLSGRHLLRRRLLIRRLAGRDTQRTLVVGNVRTVGPMIRQLRRAQGAGMEVVGACVSGIVADSDRNSLVEGVPVFGYPEEAMEAIDLLEAEVVAVSSDPDLSGSGLRRLAWSLEERKVDLVIAPGLFEVAGPRLSIRPTAGMPLLHVERPAMSGARRVCKRLVDLVTASLLLLLTMPITIAIALAIRWDSPGPVIFRQTRVGEKGRTFSMLKFRTMCVDAEQRRADLMSFQAVDAGNDILFKMRRDPRVTRVGRVLRRLSLDEAPQLVNVVRGEMSLVGPRPPLQEEVDRYEPDAVRRLHVQPGLTGLWQVSGRSDLPWDESLRLDLWYVDNWSLVLDVQILTRTIRAVLKGQGAY